MLPQKTKLISCPVGLSLLIVWGTNILDQLRAKTLILDIFKFQRGDRVLLVTHWTELLAQVEHKIFDQNSKYLFCHIINIKGCFLK